MGQRGQVSLHQHETTNAGSDFQAARGNLCVSRVRTSLLSSTFQKWPVELRGIPHLHKSPFSFIFPVPSTRECVVAFPLCYLRQDFILQMELDHIGIVSRSLESSLVQWRDVFGYRQATEPVVNTRNKVRVMFLEKPGSLPVKLVEPIDETSPAFQFAQRGGGLHHMCFRVADLHQACDFLSANGGRVLRPPEPGEAFESEDIAFVYLNGLNIELIATEKRAGAIAPSSITPSDRS